MITFTNTVFDPINSTPDQIELLDIAVSLSRVPRWVGHTHHFYSVSEHSILTSELCRKRNSNRNICLLALFHDAAEAYISDIPSPVKIHLKPTITVIEDGITKSIYSKFNITPPTPEEKIFLKALDIEALEIEDQYLRKEAWQYIIDKESVVKTLPFMSNDQAALAFMRQYYLLNNLESR